MTKTELFDFMSKPKLGVLGTISLTGSPQSSLVGIAVTPELEIIFDTVKSTRKYRNLMSNPACSFAIGWEGEVTVQYEGEAREPEAGDLARYQAVYFAKWTDGPARLSWPGITYFVARPKWIRHTDYDRSPQVEEFKF